MKRQDRAEAEATANERLDQAVTEMAHGSSFRARFGRIATGVSNATGSVWAFSAALLVILVWIATGPIFGFSDTWQLVINTSTTIVTFLMVFLIQNTQNRDAKATQLKLDELIRAVAGARNEFIDAEDEPEEQIDGKKRALLGEKHKTPHASRNGEPAQRR